MDCTAVAITEGRAASQKMLAGGVVADIAVVLAALRCESDGGRPPSPQPEQTASAEMRARKQGVPIACAWFKVPPMEPRCLLDMRKKAHGLPAPSARNYCG